MAAKKMVAIIDDDPVIIMTTAAVLESAGFETVSAGNEQEARSLAESSNPDIVLCDMMMESLDTGLAVMRAFRDRHPRTPIFLMSSIADAMDMTFDLAGLELAGFLKKPVDPEILLNAVNGAVAIGE
jgi:CheY-like chemotaxis protein